MSLWLNDKIIREKCPFVEGTGHHLSRIARRQEQIDGEWYEVTRYECCGQMVGSPDRPNLSILSYMGYSWDGQGI